MKYKSYLTLDFFIITSILLFGNIIRAEVDYNNLLNLRADFKLPESQIRFARLRCSQKYPQADAVNFTDTSATHCYADCLLYKMGLMNLKTRGLDSYKFLDIWDDIDEAFEEKCMDKFQFDEPLSGKCSESYRKLMEFRVHCWELFDFTFGLNSTWKSKELSKSIGQSASEFCDSLENDEVVTESSRSLEVTFLAHYKSKLVCLYQNYHYLDAYGRVDESEILRSYQQVNMYDGETTRAIIRKCAHQANSKYQPDYAGDLVYELQTCLKQQSPAFLIVSQRRDEISRGY